ncbi:MAG: hypothetical protein RL150_408 [Candidatus Parcubacteria bacterium]|jgi:hypothetical protein
MQAGPRYQSDTLKQRKRKRRTWKGAAYVILFVLLLAGATYASHHPVFRVEQIVVNDLTFTDRAAVELAVKETLQGRYLGLFARANSLTLPRHSIEQRIMREHAAVASVDVDIDGLHTISLEVKEYAPVARWCNTTVTPAPALVHDDGELVTGSLPQPISSRNGDQCFLLNAEAIVFAPVPTVTVAAVPADLITFFGRITRDPLRQQYTSRERFEDILAFARLVRRLDIVVTEAWTVNDEVYSLVTQPGAQLFVDTTSDLGETFTNLETVITRDAINRAQFANILYIDLRFGNRVFYKLR